MSAKRSPGSLEAAATALIEDFYGLRVQRAVVAASHTFNTVVRVDTPTGDLAVRIGDGPRIHPPATEEIEAEWLSALSEAGFVVPVPVAGTDGAFSHQVQIEGADRRHIGSVFRWIDATPVGYELDDRQAEQMGVLAAELHAHSEGFQPSRSPRPIAFDRAVYLPDRSPLETSGIADASLVGAAAERVQETIDDLWRSPPHAPQLLHGDLGAHNLLERDAALFAIDFQDLRFGFAIQDLAITVSDLLRRQPEMVQLFVSGYSTLRDWPAAPAGVWRSLIAARSLNIINLSLHVGTPEREMLMGRHTAVLRACMNDCLPVDAVTL